MAPRKSEIQIIEMPGDALTKAQNELVALDKRAEEMADAATKQQELAALAKLRKPR